VFDILVGVAGFEPATPASRTHRPDPRFSQYQRLNTTSDDACDRANGRFRTPACSLRAKALFTQFMDGAPGVAPSRYAVASRKAGCRPGASALMPLFGTPILAGRRPGR
jgi:hypothetical protein